MSRFLATWLKLHSEPEATPTFEKTIPTPEKLVGAKKLAGRSKEISKNIQKGRKNNDDIHSVKNEKKQNGIKKEKQRKRQDVSVLENSELKKLEGQGVCGVEMREEEGEGEGESDSGDIVKDFEFSSYSESEMSD